MHQNDVLHTQFKNYAIILLFEQWCFSYNLLCRTMTSSFCLTQCHEFISQTDVLFANLFCSCRVKKKKEKIFSTTEWKTVIFILLIVTLNFCSFTYLEMGTRHRSSAIILLEGFEDPSLHWNLPQFMDS